MFEIKVDLPLTEVLKARILKNIQEKGFNKGVAGILRLDSNYVFLINQKEPFNKEWIFVSGGVEPDELPEDAIVREVFEETGLRVNDRLKIGELVIENLPNSTIEVFDCTCFGQVILGNKIRAIGSFDKNNLPINMNGICKKILELIQERSRLSVYLARAMANQLG